MNAVSRSENSLQRSEGSKSIATASLLEPACPNGAPPRRGRGVSRAQDVEQELGGRVDTLGAQLGPELVDDSGASGLRIAQRVLRQRGERHEPHARVLSWPPLEVAERLELGHGLGHRLLGDAESGRELAD